MYYLPQSLIDNTLAAYKAADVTGALKATIDAQAQFDKQQLDSVAAQDTAIREAELAGQSALLQSTLENMGEGLSVFDKEGRLIAWNSRFASLVKAPIDLSKVVVNLNMDMIGRTKNANSVDNDPSHYLVDPGGVLLVETVRKTGLDQAIMIASRLCVLPGEVL